MTRYLLKRAFSGLLMLYLLMTGLFFFVQILVPGDFAGNFTLSLSPEQVEALRAQLGFDAPLLQQYIDWLGSLLSGGLGRSYFGARPVIQTVRVNLPNSLAIFASGLVFAYLIGQWLGRVTGWRGTHFTTEAVTFTAIAFYAFFPPALAFVLRLTLAEGLGLFPENADLFRRRFVRSYEIEGWVAMWQVVGTLMLALALTAAVNWAVNRLARKQVHTLLNVPLVLGAWVGLSALLFGEPALTQLHGIGLAVIAFTLLSVGDMVVIMRTAITDERHAPYIMTARAKGLRERTVRDRHATRNAILPVLSKLVISLPYLLAGLAIIEQTLDWTGLGSALFYYIGVQDVPSVLGYILVIGVIALAARLSLDVMYAVLDPRIRFNRSTSQ